MLPLPVECFAPTMSKHVSAQHWTGYVSFGAEPLRLHSITESGLQQD